MTVDFGVLYADTNGGTFVAPGFTEAAARRLVADADARAGRRVTVKTDPRYTPRPLRVVTKTCGCPWLPAPTKEN